eukprot:GFUD01021033.1.p1 GENE.GFUD01021033.1~~GFUD01021033.1.p1  ORF type:complete len:1054 (-),score=234.72 GFUD01021033.1:7-3144(-)
MGTKVVFLYLLVLFAVAKANIEKLRCPSRVERFSSKISLGHFYQCNEERYPVLMECPQGELYNMQKQTCASKEDTPKNKAIDEKAMGRSFQLGTFYDVKKSQFFEDSSFWSQNTIRANSFTYDRKEVNTDFRADKTVHDKTSHFDISAKLSMDFMGGMVSVSGAMSYLDDDVSSEKEVNVEMLYHTTKYTETLPKYTTQDYGFECKNINNPYTHVVTSVTYGLDCNFVFKYMLSEHETESSITGELSIAINNIPSFSISGSGSVNLTESEKSLMERTSLKMYGDFSLDSDETIPSNFDQACGFYKRLPILATTQASILEVHMTPIEDFCTAEGDILNEISDSMMAEVIDMLDKLNQLEIKAKGLMITDEANKFPALKKNLNKYKVGLKAYTDNILNQLQDILPNIRGGDGHGEDDLVKLLHEYTQSPFEFDTSDQFLIDRNREISAISFLLASFPDDPDNIAVVDYEQGSDVDFLINHDYVIMLDFKILTPLSLTENFLNGNTQNESNFWYNSIAVNGHVGSLLRNFSDFALENAGEASSKYGYMINLKVIDDNQDDPTTMTALYKGQVITDHFVVPSAPLEPYIQDISYDEFRFIVPKFNEFTNGLKVTVTNVYDGFNFEETTNWEEAEGEDIEIIINKQVDPATVYLVVAQYTTRVGDGPKGLSSRLFITAPSSPPANLAISDITTNSLKVSWDRPNVIGSGIPEEDLVYSIELTGEDGYVERRTTSTEHEFVFEDLVDATKYNIEAKTFLEAHDLGFSNSTVHALIFISMSQPAIIYQNSNPLAPRMIPSMPGEVTSTSAIVRWEPPTKLPEYDTLTYNLVYAAVDGDGNLGEEVLVSVGDTHFELTGLPMATMYAFKVQVVTNLGQSEFSASLVVKTQDEESEIGHFGDEVKERLEDIKTEMKRRSSFCASQSVTTSTAGTLTYEKVFLDQNNIVDAAMDASTGIFKAGAAGSYQVMVSVEVVSEPGQQHSIWVAVNGENKMESLIHTIYDGNRSGSGSDNASREIVLGLNAGDTVSIFHETEGASLLANVVFCISSIKLS